MSSVSVRKIRLVLSGELPKQIIPIYTGKVFVLFRFFGEFKGGVDEKLHQLAIDSAGIRRKISRRAA
jgi:hypothetical protein